MCESDTMFLDSLKKFTGLKKYFKNLTRLVALYV